MRAKDPSWCAPRFSELPHGKRVVEGSHVVMGCQITPNPLHAVTILFGRDAP